VKLVTDHVRVTVPGSAGNLGPGFDCLGMAVDVVDEITVEAIASTNVVVEVEGEGAQTLPRDESHLFVKAFRVALESVEAPLTGLRIHAKNRIPHARGLGSSAATVVAGISAARAMVSEPERLPPEVVLRLATDFEGHPDNAAPAIYGGATVSWIDKDGPHARALEIADGIETAVLIPDAVLPTKEARAVLPAHVPHADAAFNVSRAALLVHALAGRPEVLFEATEDMLHQDYRAERMPAAMEMMRTLRAKGLAAVISGAGPSVLVIGEECESKDLGPGPLAWAEGIGGQSWNSILTSHRVPGVSATALT